MKTIKSHIVITLYEDNSYDAITEGTTDSLTALLAQYAAQSSGFKNVLLLAVMMLFTFNDKPLAKAILLKIKKNNP